ncbi:hypothetical protein D3C76_839670 [compost metagenome]
MQHGADLFVAQPGVEQLQRLVHHRRQVQAFAQTAGAFAGEGFQVAGEGGHAREHFIHRFERFVGVVDPAVVEQQAQGRQLHALGGERLVDLMGQGGGHLPQRREFGRLHQAFLGGAQVAGTLFYKLFEFFAAALAQFGQAPALGEKQQQKHQRQPDTRRSERGVAAVFEGNLRAAQQVQGPAFGGQRQGFPQVIGRAVGAIDPCQVAVFVEAAQ